MTERYTLLQTIANTLLANLGNTPLPGLVQGKMALSLFFYQYSRLTGIKAYENVANELVDEITGGITSEVNASLASGLSGIGIGIIQLIKSSFLEDTDDADALADIEHKLMELAMDKDASPNTLISVATYLIYREKFYNRNLDQTKVRTIGGKVKDLLASGVIDEQYGATPTASVVNYTLAHLSLLGMETGAGFWKLPEYSLCQANQLSGEAVWNGLMASEFQPVELIMSWPSIVELVNTKCKYCFYDPNMVNSLLSGIGLNLILDGMDKADCL